MVEKTFEPPKVVRWGTAAVLGLGWIGTFIAEPSLRNALWCLLFCPLAVLMAVSPRYLRDGRSLDWENRHPILLSAYMSAWVGLGGYLFLSTRLDDRLSIELAVPAGLAYGVLVGVLGRRRRSRRAQS
ncbi:hypothetical protein [Kribbella voronezhensis]|uniref:hypothetical protein n=1 Tax=Kribbella voronezhensis TaxID=2512212 RepID=UPI001063E654|nr:hypothetical protein [Kribbella voronezhensis]